MFACDVTELSAAETLASAARLHEQRNRTDVELLELALHFADLHPDPATVPGHETVPGGERGVVYGGPGCPAVAEFAVAEFGAVIGRSTASAAAYLGQALALRHRLPRILAQVRSGHATAWKACTIATACLTLSEQAAAIVDHELAGIVDTVTPHRIANIVRAAVWRADPEAAQAAAETNAKQRGVWPGRTDEHGTTTLYIKAATGDIIRLNTTLTQLADALADLGDTDPLDQRRAKAIGLLTDPDLTRELLAIAQHLTEPPTPTPQPTAPDQVSPDEPGADDEADRDGPHPSEPAFDLLTEPPPAPAHRPNSNTNHHHTGPGEAPSAGEAPGAGMDAAARRELAQKLAALKQHAHSNHTTGGTGTGSRPARTTLYVHITDQTLLTGGGITRVERFGPVYAARLQELLGHDQITLKPVIDLNNKISVDAYEIPRRIREHIKLTHPVEQFPYGTAETTHNTDLDHIQPYTFNTTGPPDQTSTTNLTPLRRYSHRVKTHGHWTVDRLNDGALQWTTKHGYKFRVDHTGTHPSPTSPDDLEVR
ncbi:DUF222 domain-containing protein [Kribbella sp. VKM Ac-2568]|uniref:DUF222 domain-containing protein n=1 Tax=Kribbella sp. VKM Ac-2568 TaxID=2512219 RepID=UPI0010524A06|nr:DUF222 domain-containing protein [Kribbella sp. VKM Ac-2568]TCM48269.1 uncharacterized protein DUF222 [Kribbella sp. VKM Ac-2568]